MIAHSYLAQYRTYDLFVRRLEEFYHDHCHSHLVFIIGSVNIWAIIDAANSDNPATLWAQRYLDALQILARDHGLDRFGVTQARTGVRFYPSAGHELIDLWCRLSARSAEDHGVTLPGSLFGTHFVVSGWLPDIGEVVEMKEYVARDRNGETVIVEQARLQPLVHIHLDATWDPREEAMRTARRRLRTEAARLIDTELERIAAETERINADAEEADQRYVFPDTAPQQAKHLRWLFEYLALRKSYNAIATAEFGDYTLAPTVYHGIKRYADLLRIKLDKVSTLPKTQ